MKHSGKEREEGMEQILEEHEVIFAKPRELPPPPSYDHCIILQKGLGYAPPIC
jgi:hypothetical protein